MISSAIEAESSQISNWLAGHDVRLVFDHDAEKTIGHQRIRGYLDTRLVSTLRVILCRQHDDPRGYRLATAFPRGEWVTAIVGLNATQVRHRFPALAHLCGAYLHPDWYQAYGGPWTALNAFITESPDKPHRIHDEVTHILNHFAEEHTKPLVEVLGSYYMPEPDGHTYRSWLAAIDTHTREILNRRREDPRD